MTECPACRLAMESHTTAELLDCCTSQVGGELEDPRTCPNCRHGIEGHSDAGLAECMLDFLKSGAR